MPIQLSRSLTNTQPANRRSDIAVGLRQRQRAVRAAAAELGQSLGQAQHRLFRIDLGLVSRRIERNHDALRVAPQDAAANRAATSTQRILLVAPRPRSPVTAEPIEPDTSRPITTGPGNSGTLPHAISAALQRRLDLLRHVRRWRSGTRPKTGTGTAASGEFRPDRPAGRQCNRPSRIVRADHSMANQRVQVHAQRLRTHLSRDRRPDRRALGRIGQQVPAERRLPRISDLLLRRFRLAEAASASTPPANRPPWPAPTSRPACRSASRTAPGGRCRSASAGPGAARRAGSDRCRSTPRAVARPRLLSHR